MVGELIGKRTKLRVHIDGGVDMDVIMNVGVKGLVHPGTTCQDLGRPGKTLDDTGRPATTWDDRLFDLKLKC